MSKNSGGKKGRAFAKKSKNENARDFPTKELGQEYGQVTKKLGNCRFEVKCLNGKTMLCVLLNSRKRKFWLVTGDVVLVGLRDFEPNKADLLHKYTRDQLRMLHQRGQVPLNFVPDSEDPGQEDGPFVFMATDPEAGQSDDETGAMQQAYDPFDLSGLDASDSDDEDLQPDHVDLDQL